MSTAYICILSIDELNNACYFVELPKAIWWGFKMDVVLNTDGNGLWSQSIKAVRIMYIELMYDTEAPDGGELCVYFDGSTWDVDEDGLIYTDKLFLEQLRCMLAADGLSYKDVDYSEQGMQGADYVSLDVGADFINSWLDKYQTRH